MSLSKKTRRNLGAFNRAQNPIYHAKRLDVGTDIVRTYANSYLKITQEALNGSDTNKVGEVA